jgi:hypothetical protein
MYMYTIRIYVSQDMYQCVIYNMEDTLAEKRPPKCATYFGLSILRHQYHSNSDRRFDVP